MTGANSKMAALLYGAKALQSGYAEVDAGITVMTEKLNNMLDSLALLTDGINTLVTQYTVLDDGTRAYTGVVSEILAGQQQVTAGSSALLQGSTVLKGGTSSLHSGTESMLSGIASLKDGTGALYDGTVELDDGVQELLEGAEELHDGMENYKKDGIEKVVNLYGDNIPLLIHRLEALQKLGQGYQNYSGIADDAVGDVKFLIRTEGIEAKSDQ